MSSFAAPPADFLPQMNTDRLLECAFDTKSIIQMSGFGILCGNFLPSQRNHAQAAFICINLCHLWPKNSSQRLAKPVAFLATDDTEIAGTCF
jgi:hypothetical protein